MNHYLYCYKGNGRDLKKIITTLLKTGKASEIQKTNYCNSFSINNNKIEKTESKLLIIHTNKEEELRNFITKTFPYLERID